MLKKYNALKKENKRLQSLLLQSDQELAAIIQKNQQENSQIQSLLSSVWPKLNNRTKKEGKEMSTQKDEEPSHFMEHLESLEYYLDIIENAVSDGMNQDLIMQAEIENTKMEKQSLKIKIKDSENKRSGVLEEIEGLKNELETLQEEEQTILALLSIEEAPSVAKLIK